MEEEYRNRQGQFSIVPTFKQKLIQATESGLLIFIKWALVIGLAYLALMFGTNVVSGSQNGTNAVIYLNELQNKGWLPKVVGGQVPTKPEANTNETNSK